jgi:hypothetical protein
MLYCLRVSVLIIEYSVRNVHVNQEGLKLNGRDQLLFYIDDVT